MTKSIALADLGKAQTTALPILLGLSFCHLLNDMNQSLLAAIYPTVKASMGLSYAQIGMVSLAYQAVASLLQPLVGIATDRAPRPHSLSLGMLFTLAGLLLLSVAGRYPLLILAAMLVGTGSSIFHPESSRIARLASGGRHGLAQSLFQVGGNVGTACGPLLAAFIVGARGQGSLVWFIPVPLLACLLLWRIGDWAMAQGLSKRRRPAPVAEGGLSSRQKAQAMVILLLLIMSKYIYLASLSSYYTFYLIQTFQLSVRQAQFCLFLFLAAVALGAVAGGPLGDRFGRRYVIWFSILGVLPFSMALPWVGLLPTVLLSIVIGLVLSSAFSAILVFGQELMPHRIGTVAGLFFGLAFGVGGLGAAGLGWLADHSSITFVYRLCGFLPILGLLAALLPDRRR